MRIGVVQHRLRSTPEDDVRAITSAVRTAVERGAETVIVPCVGRLENDAVHDGILAAVRESDLRCGLFAPTCSALGRGGAAEALYREDAVGSVVLMCGDTCFDESVWKEAALKGPAAAVLSPLAESDLQAEAAIEVALGLSDALCGLVIVAECTGAEPGEPGHGGSAVIVLGDVVAEALDDDDVLIADVRLPVSQPEPRAPYPEVPAILAQRVAHHAGRRLDVGYFADLGDDPGAR